MNRFPIKPGMTERVTPGMTERDTPGMTENRNENLEIPREIPNFAQESRKW